MSSKKGLLRIPYPYWCSSCHKQTNATVRGDGKNHQLVCPTCGNEVSLREKIKVMLI